MMAINPYFSHELGKHHVLSKVNALLFFIPLTTGQICPVHRTELSVNKNKKKQKQKVIIIFTLNKLNLNIN